MHKSWQSFLFLTNPKPICSMCFRLFFVVWMPLQQDQVLRNTGLRWVGDGLVTLVRLLICTFLALDKPYETNPCHKGPLLPSSRKIRASELHQDTKPNHAQPLHSTSDLFFLGLGLRLSCVMEHGNMVQGGPGTTAFSTSGHHLLVRKNVKCPKKMIEAAWSHWQNHQKLSADSFTAVLATPITAAAALP